MLSLLILPSKRFYCNFCGLNSELLGRPWKLFRPETNPYTVLSRNNPLTLSTIKFIRLALVTSSSLIFVELLDTNMIRLPNSLSLFTASTDPGITSFSSHKTPSQSNKTVSIESRNFSISGFDSVAKLVREEARNILIDCTGLPDGNIVN